MCSVPHALLALVVALSAELMFCSKSNYERFEQFFGQEYADLDLRVRKYNRTTTTLNGSVFIRQPMDDTIVFSSDVFHSRLGNQQFQHYPMRLPTSGFCQFMNHLHTDYPTIIDDVVNISQLNECPVSERTLIVEDQVFPHIVLPDTISPGLWKIVITGTKGPKEEVVFRMMISIRLYDDFYL